MNRAELRVMLAAQREATLSGALVVYAAITTAAGMNHPEVQKECAESVRDLIKQNTIEANLRAVDQLLEKALGPAIPNARERVTR